MTKNAVVLADDAIRASGPLMPTEWLNIGLTMRQLEIMLVLFENGPTRVSVLVSSMSEARGGALDHLARRGLVLRERDPDNRRMVLCKLSTKGQQLMTRLWEIKQVRTKRPLENDDACQLHFVAETFEIIC